MPVGERHWESHHVYAVEWRAGEGGYLRWLIDGHLVFEARSRLCARTPTVTHRWRGPTTRSAGAGARVAAQRGAKGQLAAGQVEQQYAATHVTSGANVRQRGREGGREKRARAREGGRGISLTAHRQPPDCHRGRIDQVSGPQRGRLADMGMDRLQGGPTDRVLRPLLRLLQRQLPAVPL